MKLTKLTLPNFISDSKGLSTINLQRLDSLIVLVGKNGSGKTRILDGIESYIRTNPLTAFLQGDLKDTPEIVIGKDNDILSYSDVFLEKINKNRTSEPKNNKVHDVKVLNVELTKEKSPLIGSFNFPQLDSSFRKLSNYLYRIKKEEIQNLQQALDRAQDDTNPVSFEILVERFSNNIDYNEITLLHTDSLNYIGGLPNQLALDLMHCKGKMEFLEKKDSYKRFLSLKKIFYAFFEKELDWEPDFKNIAKVSNGITSLANGQWKIDERIFNYQEFSDGEKTLFAYVLLFFLLEQTPHLRIRESIILVDEPELHLHPDAEIKIVDGIHNIVKEKGQLWIATHSLNIVSNQFLHEIFVVNKGKVIPPSHSTPGKAIHELFNLEHRLEKLLEFVSHNVAWSFTNFITQCFLNPDVIELPAKNDPQIIAFKKAVLESSKTNNMLLDFGAGGGRLFHYLLEDGLLNEKLTYEALEPNENLAKNLEALSVNKVYRNYESLPKSYFDHIVICNVLHEVKLSNWTKVLNSLLNSLKEDGYLVIIEDLFMPKGEKIEEAGFLILGSKELQKLFQLNNPPSLIKVKGFEERILCALISKKDCHEVTVDSIQKALVALEENTFEQLEVIKTESVKEFDLISKGRKTALLSQLNINARMGLKIINNLKNPVLNNNANILIDQEVNRLFHVMNQVSKKKS